MIKVNEDKCTGCANCLPYCPEEAIQSWGLAVIDKDQCNACLICVEWCPLEAIEVQR